uniref:Uncharacterized protein n=1 Tax=Fagus sylvatica TaxID=28930 RepID=A0A2N9IZL9_FAGSY
MDLIMVLVQSDDWLSWSYLEVELAPNVQSTDNRLDILTGDLQTEEQDRRRSWLSGGGGKDKKVHALRVGEDTAVADGSENALRCEWLKVQIRSTRARIPTRFESDIRADSALNSQIQELYRQKELFRQHQLQQQHHHHKWIS